MVLFLTIAIFALAEAQPHHNARHTEDDRAELMGLTPEVVIPTEEVETTSGVRPVSSALSSTVWRALW